MTSRLSPVSFLTRLRNSFWFLAWRVAAVPMATTWVFGRPSMMPLNFFRASSVRSMGTCWRMRSGPMFSDRRTYSLSWCVTRRKFPSVICVMRRRMEFEPRSMTTKFSMLMTSLLLLLLNPQERKPQAQRDWLDLLQGRAHNVHKVDVCALSFLWYCRSSVLVAASVRRAAQRLGDSMVSSWRCMGVKTPGVSLASRRAAFCFSICRAAWAIKRS